MINRTPQIMPLAIDLDEHFSKAPASLAEPTHARDTRPPDIGRKPRSKAVPPQPYRLVADVDPALEQQILDVAQG
jgi:hypothetical protein